MGKTILAKLVSTASATTSITENSDGLRHIAF